VSSPAEVDIGPHPVYIAHSDQRPAPTNEARYFHRAAARKEHVPLTRPITITVVAPISAVISNSEAIVTGRQYGVSGYSKRVRSVDLYRLADKTTGGQYSPHT
jgi:hypothetical protein